MIKKGIGNYFYCEGDDCDFMSKKRNHLVYFKGRYLCHHCKIKSSKALCSVPKVHLAESTLRRYTKLPEGLHMPKESRIGYVKVTDEMRSWAERKEKKIKATVYLKYDEHKFLWSHFSKQGLSVEDIKAKIEKIKENIKKSHDEYNQGKREEVSSFKEEFEKLIGVSQ